MRPLLTAALALACLCLTHSSALAWGKPRGYTAVPAVQVAPVGSGYVLVPNRHHFGHHHYSGQYMIMAGGYTMAGSYTQPAPYTGCSGSYTQPVPYTGCSGSYTQPAPYTGCSGGAASGSLTNIDRRISRWKSGGVEVEVDVRVRVDGTVVKKGTSPDEDDPAATPSRTLAQSLQEAIDDDIDARRGASDKVKDFVTVYNAVLRKVRDRDINSTDELNEALKKGFTDKEFKPKEWPDTRGVLLRFTRKQMGEVDRDEPWDRPARQKAVRALSEIVSGLKRVREE